MESTPKTTNQEIPSHGEPFVFSSYGNIGPPFIATLSLPGLTIGLLVWFLSTPVIPNSPAASYASTPPRENQPPIDLFPSSPVGYSSYCYREIPLWTSGFPLGL
jgi:hypothetical protein